MDKFWEPLPGVRSLPGLLMIRVNNLYILNVLSEISTTTTDIPGFIYQTTYHDTKLHAIHWQLVPPPVRVGVFLQPTTSTPGTPWPAHRADQAAHTTHPGWTIHAIWCRRFFFNTKIFFNTGLGYDVLPGDTNPLYESMLTHHRSPLVSIPV